jgi:hypothetical protein
MEDVRRRQKDCVNRAGAALTPAIAWPKDVAQSPVAVRALVTLSALCQDLLYNSRFPWLSPAIASSHLMSFPGPGSPAPLCRKPQLQPRPGLVVVCLFCLHESASHQRLTGPHSCEGTSPLPLPAFGAALYAHIHAVSLYTMLCSHGTAGQQSI